MRFVVIVCGLLACRSESRQAPAPAPAPAPEVGPDEVRLADTLAPERIGVRTSAEADARVAKAFPNGPATEDARAEIGTADPPLDRVGPDPQADWIAELAITKAIELATLRAAISSVPPATTMNGSHSIYGQTAAGAWEFAERDDATGPYRRIAVTSYIAMLGLPLSADELDAQIEFARALFAKLDKRPPVFSMTKQDVLAKGAALKKLTSTLAEDVRSVEIAVMPPQGKKLPARLVWDVVYSAGFRWGDGDYFHWRPSPSTDVSQGIKLDTTSEPGYFMPEWIDKPEGRGLEDLHMSFDVLRTHQPEAVFEVMLRSARYMARRLGGTVVTVDHKPFDEKTTRARVVKLVNRLNAEGVTPGSNLALTLF